MKKSFLLHIAIALLVLFVIAIVLTNIAYIDDTYNYTNEPEGIRTIYTRDDVGDLISYTTLRSDGAATHGICHTIDTFDALSRDPSRKGKLNSTDLEKLISLIEKLKPDDLGNFSGPNGSITSVYKKSGEKVDIGGWELPKKPRNKAKLIKEIKTLVDNIEWDENEN